jgi:RNA polymerase sigma-70 factor (ECF subfamily)
VDHWRAHGQATFISIDDDERCEADDVRALVDTLPGSALDEPHVRAASSELGSALVAALETLPAEQRDAFLLQYEGGLSLAEIGELTGVGSETVKSRLRYAVAKLRDVLGPQREAWS